MSIKKSIFSNIVNSLLLPKKKGKTIVVLGMHRSGTSCLTGLLKDAGVYLGNVSTQNPHNAKGNQENLRIMHLHDAVLADSNATWDHPPEDNVIWRTERIRELFNIIKEYEGEKVRAFKDPRVLFVLDGWLKTIPDLHFVGTFRHPNAVAQSLYNRGKMPPDEAFRLWFMYNDRLLFYQKKFGFDIVNFSLEPDPYLTRVSYVLKRMGLFPSDDKCSFFDTSLLHAGIDESQCLPAEVKKMYQKLQDVSL